MNWSSSTILQDEFFEILENTLPDDNRKFEVTRYLKETYFDRNGQWSLFSYLNWNHFDSILNGEFDTTTNSSESILWWWIQINYYCLSKYKRIQEKILAKRGLIKQFGEKKMSKMKPKTLKRQAEIRRIVRAISHMDIETEIAFMPQFFYRLGFR